MLSTLGTNNACEQGADVASMAQTVRLSSPNRVGELQNFAIVAVVENRTIVEGCLIS